MAAAVAGIEADVAVMAAAVADFRPARPSEGKLARADGPPDLALEPTPDVLAEVAKRSPPPFLVGFAAEAGGLERIAGKAAAKGVDLLVANDTVQNFLFVNQKDGTFVESGALSGVAFDRNGNARGAMGIDSAQFRNDAGLGIAIGNFANEMTALYVARERNLQFYDEAVANGLGPATRLQLSFGLFFFDYDLDGRLDLFQANGHLEQDIQKVQASQAR